eukprot:CAMPEP_0197258872 /NCGR_PEP_ID=MMETSP1429-20130617/83226_1 /TAXON_ID=49237 /ORGANISM="Chaetoceros  sp., Strain UNC1202" /LENGTH=525 /DNA_ID=CAMNT_0042723061 /DNA_START=104 /DNA_END=1681 /DNA_ORIENTATION=-
MKFRYLLAFLLTQADSAAAFTTNFNAGSTIGNAKSSTTSMNARTPTHEESAAQMTAYLARSHEAKIRALRDLEEKKNTEIKELKARLNGSAIVQAGGSSTSSGLATPESKPLPVTTETIEILQKKLEAYRKFMSDYIVKAQEDKGRAVKAAEFAIAEKYNAKLNAFMLEGAGAGVSTVSGVQPKLFQDRNAKVAAAAKAGKSRWGDKESARAAGSTTVPVPPSTMGATPAAPVSDFEKRNAFIAAAASAGKQYRWGGEEEERAIDSTAAAALPSVGGKSGSFQVAARPAPVVEAEKLVTERVVDADHGLRADGGVGGLSLADRVRNGAAAAAATGNVSVSFEKRNAFIAAAASAGKQYRWGGEEEERAIDSTAAAALPSVGGKSGSFQVAARPAPVVEAEKLVTERVADADHGLRADGGVGGLSLADRVRNGAAATGASTGNVSVSFEKRNAFIASAAAAGRQSRWGTMEEKKAIEYTCNALPSATGNIIILPEVQAADHGLRADGGVSGPSLAERVNLGAQLLH